ncbi:nucleoside hydrolase [Novosphingobium terrae]|uniref:nucleoside hydrolase n=1 Tax=Novosphingobium terrae TaxID=2726189 RepID=UPI001F135F3F|nr:nucleoside hydrolase [Novosphingobium terrae]
MSIPQHRIILDTDPGIDDAMALLFLRHRADVRIEAITTVFGNGGVALTTRNAHLLAQRFGIEAPIHPGADMPIGMERRQLATHVHGADGLGDAGLADGFDSPPEAESAAEAIVRLVHAHPGEISLLAIAPLTNLALALQLDPGIAPLVKQVVVMGGAFGFAGRRGNVSPVAEANIANDPHAADLVLGAPWPVTMVGLDVTSSCILSQDEARLIAEQGGADGQFLWDISRNYEALYREHDGIDGCCIHDVAAAACLVRPDLFETVSGPIRVATESVAIGATMQKPDHQTFPPGAWDGRPSHKACRTVDAQALIALYRDTLIGAATR